MESLSSFNGAFLDLILLWVIQSSVTDCVLAAQQSLVGLLAVISSQPALLLCSTRESGRAAEPVDADNQGGGNDAPGNNPPDNEEDFDRMSGNETDENDDEGDNGDDYNDNDDGDEDDLDDWPDDSETDENDEDDEDDYEDMGGDDDEDGGGGSGDEDMGEVVQSQPSSNWSWS